MFWKSSTLTSPSNSPRGLAVGGSTATFAIIEFLTEETATVDVADVEKLTVADKYIAKVTVANVGDSRIILGQNYGKTFVALTRDHVPTDAEVCSLNRVRVRYCCRSVEVEIQV